MAKSKPANKINVTWEYRPTPDAQARIDAAFDLIFGSAGAAPESPAQNLTENQADCIMSHDEQDSAAV